MRVNFGCGNHYAQGWWNLDVTSNHEVKPDQIGSILDLPDDLVDLEAAYCGHVLEHIPEESVVGVLTAIRGRMLPGAKLMTVGPDVNRAERMFAAGQIDGVTLAACHAGGSRWDGDRHHWDCEEAKLVQYLTEAGFSQVSPVPVASDYLNDNWPLTSQIGWQAAAEGIA